MFHKIPQKTHTFVYHEIMKLFQEIGECPEALVSFNVSKRISKLIFRISKVEYPPKKMSPRMGSPHRYAQIQDGLYPKRPGTIETSLFFNGKMDGFGVWMGFQAGPNAKKQGF